MLLYRSKYNKPEFSYPTPRSHFLLLCCCRHNPQCKFLSFWGAAGKAPALHGCQECCGSSLVPARWGRGGCGRAGESAALLACSPCPAAGSVAVGEASRAGWHFCGQEVQQGPVGHLGASRDLLVKESGPRIWHPLHLAQHKLVLFVSFLLGMWNRECVWKQLTSP